MIRRLLEVVGVEKWEDLPGKVVRVRSSYDKVKAIGNILEDEWLIFDEFITIIEQDYPSTK